MSCCADGSEFNTSWKLPAVDNARRVVITESSLEVQRAASLSEQHNISINASVLYSLPQNDDSIFLLFKVRVVVTFVAHGNAFYRCPSIREKVKFD